MTSQLRQDIDDVQYQVNDEVLDRRNDFQGFLLDRLDYGRINAALTEQGLVVGRPGGRLAVKAFDDVDYDDETSAADDWRSEWRKLIGG